MENPSDTSAYGNPASNRIGQDSIAILIAYGLFNGPLSPTSTFQSIASFQSSSKTLTVTFTVKSISCSSTSPTSRLRRPGYQIRSLVQCGDFLAHFHFGVFHTSSHLGSIISHNRAWSPYNFHLQLRSRLCYITIFNLHYEYREYRWVRSLDSFTIT
jgi:hypothetical protein